MNIAFPGFGKQYYPITITVRRDGETVWSETVQDGRVYHVPNFGLSDHVCITSADGTVLSEWRRPA